ncbi:MAG: hypothetical protein KatS3mg096_423 [Candidatus Parcubacteria bacterium]|nr:MAG: hypothetical protein KatS3mg096_423 [Candidatus Parcubacteria bacterium]
MKRRKYKTLSPPIDYWFLLTLFLASILLIFSLLLIKERIFLANMQIILEKYKLSINGFLNFNAKINSNSHLSLPTNPSSSSQIIYIAPESFTFSR